MQNSKSFENTIKFGVFIDISENLINHIYSQKEFQDEKSIKIY